MYPKSLELIALELNFDVWSEDGPSQGGLNHTPFWAAHHIS